MLTARRLRRTANPQLNPAVCAWRRDRGRRHAARAHISPNVPNAHGPRTRRGEMTVTTITRRLDAELEAAVPLFPAADLTDPATARTTLAELAARAPAPDTTGLEIEDRSVAAEPDVPVRLY